MNICQQIGMRIGFLRKQKGWSQEELSFQSGINKNYISDLENGRRNASIKILEKIANALGITLSILFQGLQSFDE